MELHTLDVLIQYITNVLAISLPVYGIYFDVCKVFFPTSRA